MSPGRNDRLLEHLSIAPVRFAACEEMDRILDIYLEPGDAELLLSLGHMPVLHGARSIARRAGVEVEHATQRLAQLAERGVIARARLLGRNLYALLPLMPGFFEFTFMKDDNYPPEVKRELQQLWSRYKREHLTPELIGQATLPQRVVPVQQSIAPQQKILTRDHVERIVEGAWKISLGNCACRVAEHNCEMPIETCLSINSFAVLMIQNGFARQISAGQAREVLHQAAQAGLVHAALNCDSHSLILCNCCGCCCVTLGALAKMGRERGMVPSSMVAQIELERCEDCGICAQRCWVDAISMDEQGVRQVDADRCIGCGVCAIGCEQGALSMVPRPGYADDTPRSGIRLLKRMTDERGMSSRLMKAMLREL
ncbi:MAG: 4Fe-4S binding protein [Candidatus Alcyoniella australis]|nr:4Fe-4S binding protein [Candidatus Alcyoniella australis]